MSRSDLAAVIGMDRGYVQRLEDGERDPSRDMALAVANAVTCDLYDRTMLVLEAGYVPVMDGAFKHLVCLMASRWQPQAREELGEQIRKVADHRR